MTNQKVYTASSLESMTIEQLIAHAASEFEVTIEPDSMGKQKIVGYLLALQDLREAGVRVSGADAPSPEVEDTAADNDKGAADAEASEIIRQSRENRVSVIFHSTPEPGGNMPIKMSLNGIAYVAKRDYEVELPESVFNACIRDARQTLFEPKVDPVTRITTVSEPREAARFSYTVTGKTPGRRTAQAA